MPSCFILDRVAADLRARRGHDPARRAPAPGAPAAAHPPAAGRAPRPEASRRCKRPPVTRRRRRCHHQSGRASRSSSSQRAGEAHAASFARCDASSAAQRASPPHRGTPRARSAPHRAHRSTSRDLVVAASPAARRASRRGPAATSTAGVRLGHRARDGIRAAATSRRRATDARLRPHRPSARAASAGGRRRSRPRGSGLPAPAPPPVKRQQQERRQQPRGPISGRSGPLAADHELGAAAGAAAAESGDTAGQDARRPSTVIGCGGSESTAPPAPSSSGPGHVARVRDPASHTTTG